MERKYIIVTESRELVSLLVYALTRAVIAFFRVLPRSAGLWIIRMLASAAFCIDARHRKIARINLRIAFPELGDRERRRIARQGFQNTALNLLEISRLPALNRDSISSLVDYDPRFGLENYRAAKARGKGILYLTGHFSAWELLPAAHALYGYPLSFITRPLDNRLLDRYLLGIRQSKGNRAISKKNSARQLLRELKSGGSAGILMDQNTSLQEGVFADLFGVPAATSSSVALLALRTGAPVLPGFLTPLRDGKYTIKFLPPVDVVRTRDTARDLEINTRRFNEVIEGIIREQPESWLWGHKRWKLQPDGNPQDLYSLSDEELDAFLTRTRAMKREAR